MRIIIATIKSWNIARAQALQKQYRVALELALYAGIVY